MNENHSKLCSSPEWADWLRDDVLAPLADAVDLGEEMLELGPGPGAATRWLRHRVARLTALELDPADAAALADQFTDVSVEIGDCTQIPYPDASFDSVGTFTMLHHLPATAMQFATLREAFRVLRPGGVLVGSDSLASPGLHAFHVDDIYNPIDPARLLVFLQVSGYSPIRLVVEEHVLTFTAFRPSADPQPAA